MAHASIHEWGSLSEQDQSKLKSQDLRGLVNSFKKAKLEKEAAQNWDKFYKRNTTKFYKDRHWTTREFQDLSDCSRNDMAKVLMEVGCGVGNFLYPLVEEKLNWFIHACDFSPRAIAFVKSNPLYDESKIHAFVHDIVTEDLTKHVADGSVDIVSLIFIMSSISPDSHEAVLKRVHLCLSDGGCVVFRDYGRYDVAQVRFRPGSKLSENFYVRQDGTRAYYFTTEELTSLFSRVGFVVVSCEYVSRRTVNKKQNVDVLRTFVQGKFVKRVGAEVSVG